MRQLELQQHKVAICRLNSDEGVPNWVDFTKFTSITNTSEELSIVCAQDCVPDHIQAQRGWRMFRVVGVLDFALTGILSSIATPLATAGVSIFAISTFDTDYILVPEAQIEAACTCLARAEFDLI